MASPGILSSPIVQVGLWFQRSVLVHMSWKLGSSWAIGGARRDRTADLLRARQALSQLSYGPFLLVFFALLCVALVAHSVTYISMLLQSLRRAP